VPVASVRLVMGDTDVCPHDVGTFGSRSMPDAGEQLRRVAASARECLRRLAAELWGVGVIDLVAADGSIRDSRGTVATYGELVQGRRQVEQATGEPPLTPGPAEQLVGHPSRRLGALGIVTGARSYPSDLSRPGMLHGRILRPPARGATLRSVDVSKATAQPDVFVLSEGSFVAVAAPDALRAEVALRAIVAKWDRPPQPSERELDAHLRAHPVEEEGWEGAFHEASGDVDAALAGAPVTLAATYTTAYIAHVPLETHVALAEWDDDRRLTVWTGTQVPFRVRRELAEALAVPEAKVRVIVPDTGGGFGGKHAEGIALEAARLARAAGCPVKVRWSRDEEFTAGYLRPAALIDIRSGAGLDGTISAWQMRNTNAGMFGLVGPYGIANQTLDYQPADAPLAQGSYRALAATANHFARESHMDELARALEVDPLALRLAHLRDERLAAAFQAAAERIGWGRELAGRGRGIGIAGGVEKGARVATAVEVNVDADRRLQVLRVVTAFDCGAIVDPDGLTNQIEGATVMGLGAALFEAVHFAGGTITNASMTEYRVPRFSDVPPIEVVLIDRRELPSAGGGETPIIAIAPALANAIFAATGTRLRSLPLVPDGVVP
jgi:isoquinoline 1-oxidoreductase